MIQFITRFIRPLGMFFIFLFAFLGIFASIVVRDIDSSTYIGTFLEYANSFENRFYDFRMKAHLDPDFQSEEIVLLKIDDYSLQKLGSWPIPRNQYAHMLDRLAEFGAKTVAMDVMFPEPSPTTGGVSPDKVFADAIRRFQQDGRRVFIAYTLAGPGEEKLEEIPMEMLYDAVMTKNEAGAELRQQFIAKYTFPISELIETEVGLGSITSREDTDGVFRQYHLLSNIETIYYGSLALNAVEAFTGEKYTFRIFKGRFGELQKNENVMEISPGGETKIRYVGSTGNFPEVSLYDLLSAPPGDPKMTELLSNKLVFVGSTATGAHDLRQAPIDPKMPGVYAHINTAHMLLHQKFFKDSNDSVTYSLLILVVGMIILIAAGLFSNAFLEALSVIVIIVSAYQIDKWYFLPQGYELKLFYCFFCFSASYSWSTFWEFWTANKEKKQIKGTFARYVAPTVVEEMLKDPEKLKIGGQKMDITCLFSDVRDFTSISESLSAADLAHSLNFYMSSMTDIVFETKGTVDKYIGDAIVALWGAPLPIGNHAQFAVEAAVRMMETMPAINEELRSLGRPEFKVGIGLNSGECSVGNMGSNRIFSYTALGDNMNLGARLEGLCKYYGAQILISEYTLERLDNSILVRPIDKAIVKGKTTPVGIFEVIHGKHAMASDKEALNFYQSAYQVFQKQNFQGALELFEQVLRSLPTDVPTLRLRDLCLKYLQNPELVNEYFDVTKMTEK